MKIVAYRGIVGNVSFFSPVSWLRFLNPRIDRIVCVAEAVRDYFLQMRPAFLRLPPERLVTIHKGHSLDWYRAAPADLTALGVPAGAFAIACVANYRPRKGIEVLVDAFGRLPLACGTSAVDRRRHGCAAARAAHRREPRCRAHSRARLPQRCAGVDGGMRRVRAAVDEARRLGAVVDRSDGIRRGARRDRLRRQPRARACTASSGLVVPVADAAALAAAMRALHDDAALRARLGAAARERIGRDFRIEDTIAKTLALYASLVAERSGVPAGR